MPTLEELKDIIRHLGTSALRELLSCMGRCEIGEEVHLQARAFDLLKLKSHAVIEKLLELRSKKVLTVKSEFRKRKESSPSVDISCTAEHCHPAVRYEKSVPLFSQKRPVVKFKDHPFFEVVSVLLEPSPLTRTNDDRFQENFFEFHLPEYEKMMVSHCDVYLRCCVLDLDNELDDEYPSGLCIKVNGINCRLMEPGRRLDRNYRRPSEPVRLTKYCRRGNINTLHVSGASDSDQRDFVVAVHLVRAFDCTTLVNRLRSSCFRDPCHTVAMINHKLSRPSTVASSRTVLKNDVDTEVTPYLTVSLLCPISRGRICVPCRSKTCTHLQCFDAKSYLVKNERQPSWACPVCKKSAPFDSLYVDGFFSNILDRVSTHCDVVNLQEDGCWSPGNPDGVQNNVSSDHRQDRKRTPDVELVDLTAGDNDRDRIQNQEEIGPIRYRSHHYSDRARNSWISDRRSWSHRPSSSKQARTDYLHRQTESPSRDIALIDLTDKEEEPSRPRSLSSRSGVRRSRTPGSRCGSEKSVRVDRERHSRKLATCRRCGSSIQCSFPARSRSSGNDSSDTDHCDRRRIGHSTRSKQSERTVRRHRRQCEHCTVVCIVGKCCHHCHE